MPAYACAIVDRLRQEKPESLVVEVGCNDGTFLGELRSAGFTRRLGVEPSQALAATARGAGHEVATCALGADTATTIVSKYGHADLLVCRHTLEHVPQPLAFLAALRSLLAPNGLACIEVPSLAPVIDRLHGEELWDEHLTYFLPHNLTAALASTGLAVEAITVAPHLDMENIVAWVRLSDRTVTAASPSTAVLNFTGLTDCIDAVVDDAPSKVGYSLPLGKRMVQIHAMVELPRLVAGGTLLLTGFGYPRWIAAATAATAGHVAAIWDVAGRFGGFGETSAG
ncbi:MAG: class I SAM-dependent methyltransferase [Rhodocyclales bacterium]|nr:class I SAM-dependent methyltransferase [Rhodocyclales bacterium]